MSWVINTFRWGEHRGGMFVEIAGTDIDGTLVRRSWHVLAESGDGPLIPSMAVQAIVRRIAAGRPPRPGARAATTDVDLADYEALFEGGTLFTGRRTAIPQGTPLYLTLLGDAWQTLPPVIREMHEGSGGDGIATVERGRTPLARLAAWLAGFPPATSQSPLSVRFERRADGAELWRRTFGSRQMTSTQEAGSGRAQYLVTERFGPAAFDMALVAENGRLNFILRRWRLLGIPLPLWLGPGSTAWEEERDGIFGFYVEVSHALTGLIVRYRGTLNPIT